MAAVAFFAVGAAFFVFVAELFAVDFLVVVAVLFGVVVAGRELFIALCISRRIVGSASTRARMTGGRREQHVGRTRS